ncbi:MAG: hypothetical protein Tsb0014_38270 [Pleurocapsa sp.]
MLTIKNSLLIAAVASLFSANSAAAFQVIQGEDINNGGLNTRATLNITQQKEQQFLDLLDATVGTEEFENVSWTAGSDLDLSFAEAGTASLGGNGEIHNITVNDSQIAYDLEQGLYPASGNQYWYTEATPEANATFNINFSQDIAAFGFYAYDLGDWGAELTLKLYSNGQLVDTISNVHTIVTDGTTTGSAIYVGIVGDLQEDGTRQTFDRIEFTTTGDDIVNTYHDIFAFDNMTIAIPEQVITYFQD